MKTTLLLGTLCLCVSPAFAAPKFNLPEARKGVVYIQRITPGYETATGSGFLVSKDGLIYTNRHVVRPSDSDIEGSVFVVGVPSEPDPDTLRFFQAKQVYTSPKSSKLDFAVLKIEAKKGEPAFRPIPLSDERPTLGSEVAVLGFPAVVENQPNLSFTKGSISSTRVRLDGISHYQTDAAVNPGNSGGPLIDPKGRVIGIVTSKQRGADRIGFAVYISEVKKAVRNLTPARLAKIKVRPGPIRSKDLPLPKSKAMRKDAWICNEGTIQEKNGMLILENKGGSYSITSQKPLPDNFQMIIKGQIEFYKGRQVIYVSQKNVLRTLCVRFATKESGDNIMERKGNLLRMSHSMTILWKKDKILQVERQGNTERPFTLVIRKQGGNYKVTYNGKVYVEYKDEKPLPSHQPVSIGGYLSRLYLRSVAIRDLDMSEQASK